MFAKVNITILKTVVLPFDAQTPDSGSATVSGQGRETESGRRKGSRANRLDRSSELPSGAPKPVALKIATVPRDMTDTSSGTAENQLTDGALVALVLEGDTESFAPIVDRYQTALLRLAKSRLGDQAFAEDAVQETFVNAFKSLRTYDSRYSFRTWLWSILLNQCRRLYKQHQTRLSAERLLLDRAASQPQWTHTDVAAGLTRAENWRLLETLLNGIPDEQADALRLRFFGDLKFQEIADAMGCSLSSAKIRVRRGLATMSEFITTKNKDSEE